MDVSHRHAVLSWIENVAYLLSWYEVGRDGRTREAEGEEGQALGIQSSENWFSGEPAGSAAVLLGSWTRCGTTLSSSGQERSRRRS